MEVKEIIRLEDPNNPGRMVNVHFTDDEFVEVVQAGLFYLLREGFIKFQGMEGDTQPVLVMPEHDTPQ